MSLLSDTEIVRRSIEDRMIEPVCVDNVRKTEDGHKVISYGLSSYGYDVRLASELKIFTNLSGKVIDPKNFDPAMYVDAEIFYDEKTKLPYFILPPNSFALGRTFEYLRIPRDCLVICLGKSTLARVGIIVNVTPLEPEWHGHVTLEFSNPTNSPVRLYADEGVAQFLFMVNDQVCATSYKDKDGKYQGQLGITTPKA